MQGSQSGINAGADGKLEQLDDDAELLPIDIPLHRLGSFRGHLALLHRPLQQAFFLKRGFHHGLLHCALGIEQRRHSTQLGLPAGGPGALQLPHAAVLGLLAPLEHGLGEAVEPPVPRHAAAKGEGTRHAGVFANVRKEEVKTMGGARNDHDPGVARLK